jgi:phage shock protein A
MPDRLQDRVTRLISGTAHALIDRMENLSPEATMAQTIREIEQVITELRDEIGTIEATKHQLTLRLSKLTSERKELSTKAELAVQEQRDDLATACLEKQTLIEDQLPVLQQNLAHQQERSRDCEQSLCALLARKQERQSLLSEYLASQRNAPRLNEESLENSMSSGTRKRDEKVERAESTFDRVMARESGLSSFTAICGHAMKLQEISDLQRKKRIDERLAELKSKQHNGKTT